MNEATRNEIVRRHQARASMRRIARELGITRHTVKAVLARVEAERAGSAAPPAGLPPVPQRRASQLDEHEAFLRDLLARYPRLTAQRAYEELRGRGFTGGYTIVRERVGQLRPQPTREPVVRFETGPGAQAQMDYSMYDIDFTQEGRRRVHAFSYVLGYSRRQYLRFVDAQDFTTTVREHIQAFTHLGGVAAVCLYDNLKVVVTQHDEDGPLYNARFLAFATHYGFKPWACRPRRAQTKGKVERPFHYVETNLLNGRDFRTLEHLNEVTAWWLANVADVRIHSETQERPLDRHAREVPHLLPLPAQPYDLATLVYRVVNVEGFIAYQQNLYSVPYRHIGQTLPVRITAADVIVYNPQIEEIARHRLQPRSVVGQRNEQAAHRPREDPRQQQAVLQERFAELGPVASRFLEGLWRQQSRGKSQACQVLALLGTYQRHDWLAALERAVRFGAYSAQAVERILAVQAQPKNVWHTLAEEERHHLQPLLEQFPVGPRPTTDYQALLNPEPAADEQTNHSCQPSNAEPA
jgi:transposase